MVKETDQMTNWTGDFGQDYIKRNIFNLEELDRLYANNFGVTRSKLNAEFLQGIDKAIKILEVGSNVGNQLRCLQSCGFKKLYGIELQSDAVEASKSKSREINIIQGSAFDIPFKDNYFDLVFTSGVLIHIHPDNLKSALKEIYRCSKKYIWGYEYFAETFTEIDYRGHKNLLWKGDFVKAYMDLYNDIKLVREKKLKYKNNQNIDVMFLLTK